MNSVEIFHLRGSVNRYANDWDDVGTFDFVTQLLEKHEKMDWMLRAHLK